MSKLYVNTYVWSCALYIHDCTKLQVALDVFLMFMTKHQSYILHIFVWIELGSFFSLSREVETSVLEFKLYTLHECSYSSGFEWWFCGSQDLLTRSLRLLKMFIGAWYVGNWSMSFIKVECTCVFVSMYSCTPCFKTVLIVPPWFTRFVRCRNMKNNIVICHVRYYMISMPVW